MINTLTNKNIYWVIDAENIWSILQTHINELADGSSYTICCSQSGKCEEDENWVIFASLNKKNNIELFFEDNCGTIDSSTITKPDDVEKVLLTLLSYAN